MVFQPQIPRVVMAAVRDALGRRVDGDFVAIPLRQRRARLHLTILNEGRRISVLEHLIGRRESRLRIPLGSRRRSRLVREIQPDITLGPNLRSIRLEGLLGIENERQLLVVDLDELERLLGHVPVDRGHGGHGLADETHRVVEHVAQVRSDILGRVAVLATPGDGARTVDHLVRLVCDDGPHARQGLSPRRVDTADARVWVRAPQDASVQHPRKPHVTCIGGLPGDTLVGIDAGDVVTNRVHRVEGPGPLSRTHAAPPDPEVPAAASTASTIAL